MRVVCGILTWLLVLGTMASAQQPTPSILLLANAPSEPSKAKLLAELANEKDLKEVPDQVKDDMTIVFVETIDQALHHVLQTDSPLKLHSTLKPTTKPVAIQH
mgnify:CR=1 FL=1